MLTAFPLLKEGALPVDGLEGDREEVEEEVGGALDSWERRETSQNSF